ncbi:hypothetical protein CEXT_277461 [Caerostris extrusa]|uniref:Uncharacterized protein n=1 Tax=Caerostris extrusa TaxID=172846 RepID=A0AAV4RY14_CAEEX|nr:hypothetical protein CEXT_277461 [Caerostris extrusa]
MNDHLDIKDISTLMPASLKHPEKNAPNRSFSFSSSTMISNKDELLNRESIHRSPKPSTFPRYHSEALYPFDPYHHVCISFVHVAVIKSRRQDYLHNSNLCVCVLC